MNLLYLRILLAVYCTTSLQPKSKPKSKRPIATKPVGCCVWTLFDNNWKKAWLQDLLKSLFNLF
jgi:hypothetical protein